MSTPEALRLVEIDKVVVVAGERRKLGPLDELTASIADAGLLQPIVVDTSLRLVCGYHRLEACRRLGWKTISALVRPFEGLHARLAEVDENLCRHELSALERGEHTALRKKLFEQMHPAPGAKNDDKNAATKKAEGFLDETAKRTKRSRSTVAEDVRIGELPDDVRDAVRETPLRDKKKELLALSKLPAEEQRAAVARVKAGEAKSVRPKDEREKRPGAIEMPVVMRTKSADPGRPFDACLRALDEATDALTRALAGWPSGLEGPDLAAERARIASAAEEVASLRDRVGERAVAPVARAS